MKTDTPPELKHVLLVDDNDRYASALTDDLKSRGTRVYRTKSAAEAIDVLNKNGHDFDGIVTDITMEHQISGLQVLSKARRNKFKGVLVTASTGLDTRIGMIFNRFFLKRFYGCSFVIPKRPIKTEGKVLWLRT